MRVDRFDARAKLSQNKSPEVRENIATRFTETNSPLAAEMRRVDGERP
jgi:transcriptional regulator